MVESKSLFEKEFILLDGAMGTMLQKRGLEMGGIPEALNMTRPDMIEEIHREYVKAGADIVYTNTFGANRYKMKESGYTVKELVSAAVKNAKAACKGSDALVALDIGPIGQLLEPTGSLTFEEAYDMFLEQIEAGSEADIIVFETMTDLLEIKAGVLAAREHSDKPVFCTMTFEQNMRTFTGCSVSAMALTLEGIGADAIGVNCSLGPKELYPVVEELAKWTTLPIIVKANAGLPDPLTGTYNVMPQDFSEYMEKMLPLGVKVMGGCCGTSPEYIRALKELAGRFAYRKQTPSIPAAVCSATATVVIDSPRIIGERINPTGKKKLKEALLNHDMDYILNQAVEQVRGGAEILDVNVGLPGIHEKDTMVQAVKELQGIVETPLQIDSTIPQVLEAALRVYCGKPIINSVNGEEKSLNTILPLAKKYGAAVVGLTLDEGGIPQKAEDRFRIAKRILERALDMGIPKENIFIDCLTLTASAEQEGVVETLKALRLVKTELGLKTVLGVSNISFGLPNRELINHTFLTLAMENGLDLPIINPNVLSMSGSVRAYRLLKGIDKNAKEYIEAYQSINSADNKSVKTEQAEKKDLPYAIENGLKKEGAEITRELLKEKDSMEIVNEFLIPALDAAGDKFEKGKIFLPQLILSAEVAQTAFGVIKEEMGKSGVTSVEKGKIVLATVKGDIHDIGKNIVKVLLENYGYQVIDLGKDVDCQKVVDAALKHKVKLVGLSALMTTTLVSMEETIRLLRENRVDCKVVVGGAVLTASYAKEIGADYYAKDAKETVDIAKMVYGD